MLVISSPVIKTSVTLTATSTATSVLRIRLLLRDSLASRDSLCRTSCGSVREIIHAGAAPASSVASTASRRAQPAPAQSKCSGPRKSSAGGRYRCMAGTMIVASRWLSPRPLEQAALIWVGSSAYSDCEQPSA
jgi:hypothetical protein